MSEYKQLESDLQEKQDLDKSMDSASSCPECGSEPILREGKCRTCLVCDICPL